MDEEEREVAWLGMPEKAPVMDEGGQEHGRAEELLGDGGAVGRRRERHLSRDGGEAGAWWSQGRGSSRSDPEDYDPSGLYGPRGGRAREAARVPLGAPGAPAARG